MKRRKVKTVSLKSLNAPAGSGDARRRRSRGGQSPAPSPGSRTRSWGEGLRCGVVRHINHVRSRHVMLYVLGYIALQVWHYCSAVS